MVPCKFIFKEGTEMICNTSDDLRIINPISSDEVIDNSVEMQEILFNEPNISHNSTQEKSTELIISPIISITNEESGIQQSIINNSNQVTDNNVLLEHSGENNAFLKLWSATSSEFVFIPCQLETLKQSTTLDEEAAGTSTSVPVTHEILPEKTYVCSICENNFDELRPFLLHCEQVHQRFQCPLCVKHFARSYLLKEHLLVHTDRREFECFICKKSFKRKCDLQRHVKGQHSTQAYTSEIFLCDTCGFQTKHERSIRLHVSAHLRVSSHICDICDKHCKNNLDLSDHRNTHFDVKSYQCNVCNVYFTRRQAMLKHRQTQHENLYSFLCDICGRSFLHKSSLNIHVKLHNGENRIECDICGKKISGKTALLNHKKIHNEQRDFICGICGRTYINKCSLQEHLLVHTGNKPFHCLQCDNSFSSRKKLLTHERIHDPHRTLHRCSYCEKSYLTKFKLKDHFRKKHHAVIGCEFIV